MQNHTNTAILFGVVAILLVATALALGQANFTTAQSGSEISWYENDSFVGDQPGGDFTGSGGITVSAVNDPSNNQVNYTITGKSISSGAATVIGMTSLVQVTHGFGSRPDRVFLTATSDLAGGNYFFVDNVTATTFDIVMGASPSINVTFNWMVMND